MEDPLRPDSSLRHELDGLKLDLVRKEAAMRQAMKEITEGWSLVARNTLRKTLEA